MHISSISILQFMACKLVLLRLQDAPASLLFMLILFTWFVAGLLFIFLLIVTAERSYLE